MMIEPCCCERQWPTALQEKGGRTVVFTNGDVTVHHIFKSLSYLAGPTHRLLLLVANPDVQLLRWMKNWLQRGWTTEVRLTSQTDVSTLVNEELGELSAKVSLAVDDTLRDELICMEGERGCVTVCGRMLTATLPGITTYACYHGKERGMMAELLAAVEARHRSHRVTEHTGTVPTCDSGNDNTEGLSPACEEKPSPKRRKKNKL